MRIANRFTTLLLLIICGLFIVSGAAGATIYPKVDGEGYYWDGSRLIIDGASASYDFADEVFLPFGIYVDAGNVTIKGPITITGYTPKWTPAIGDDSEGVELLSFSRRGSIGIGGNSAALQTLDLYDVDVVLNGRSGETLIGVIGARNVFDSTITIDAQRKTTAIGIQDLFGTFDKSEISIFGTDETILTGIDTLHGEMSGGAVTIDVQTWSNDFEITGINTLHGKISYGDFELKGRGKGSAIGIQSLHGSITDAAFTIDAYEVRGIGDVEPSGRVDGGRFDLFGDVAVGIYNIQNDGVVSDATFDVYGSSEACGIYSLYYGAHVQESEFNVFGGSEALGIFELHYAVIENGTFNVYSREGGAIGIYFMIMSVMQGGRFNVFGGSEALGIFTPYNVTIEGASFHVYSREGEAIGIFNMIDNSIQGGDFWAIIPHTGERAIGVWYAHELPSGGTITAWAPTGEKAIGVLDSEHPLSPDLEDSEYGSIYDGCKQEGTLMICPEYKFDYDGNHYMGKAKIYHLNPAIIREIYETTGYITITHLEPKEGAWIYPEGDFPRDRPRWIPVSFGSFPGYDLVGDVLVNNLPLAEEELERGFTQLRTNMNHNITTEAEINQIHIIGFEATKVRKDGTIEDGIVSGTIPLDVTFKAEAEQAKHANRDVSWKWNFGNGRQPEKQSEDGSEVTTTYNLPGIYSVLVTATDNTGSATVRKTGYVHVKSITT